MVRCSRFFFASTPFPPFWPSPSSQSLTGFSVHHMADNRLLAVSRQNPVSRTLTSVAYTVLTL